MPQSVPGFRRYSGVHRPPVSHSKCILVDAGNRGLVYIGSAASLRHDSARRKQQNAVIKSKRLPQLEKQHANFLDPAFQPNPTWWGSKTTKD